MPSFSKKDRGKWSLFSVHPVLLLLLCHLKQKSLNLCSFPAAKLLVVLSFISVSSQTGSGSETNWRSHRKPVVWGLMLRLRDVVFFFVQCDNLVFFIQSHLLAVMSTRLQPGKVTIPFISRHKDMVIPKPLQLSALAFLSPLQRPTGVMKGFWGGGPGVGSSKYRAHDGEEWGLKEVSHSQWAVIKESGSFSSSGKGEAHLIKTEMFQPPVKTHSWKKKSRAAGRRGERGEILDWGLDNTESLLCERSFVALFRTFQGFSVWKYKARKGDKKECRDKEKLKGQKHLNSKLRESKYNLKRMMDVWCYWWDSNLNKQKCWNSDLQVRTATIDQWSSALVCMSHCLRTQNFVFYIFLASTILRPKLGERGETTQIECTHIDLTCNHVYVWSKFNFRSLFYQQHKIIRPTEAAVCSKGEK